MSALFIAQHSGPKHPPLLTCALYSIPLSLRESILPQSVPDSTLNFLHPPRILDILGFAVQSYFSCISSSNKAFNNLISSQFHVFFIFHIINTIFTLPHSKFTSLTNFPLIFEHLLCIKYLHFWHWVEFLITVFPSILHGSKVTSLIL